MKRVSLSRWPGHGGMVQVTGTDAFAKAAIKILEEYDCPVTGWTVTGSRGQRIYTYKVTQENWVKVKERLESLDDELQMDLFNDSSLF